MDEMLTPRVHRVLAVIEEIPDVVTLRVEPVGADPPPFLPAQIGMVGAFGVGEAALSISSSPLERRCHEYTVRRSGAITGALNHLVAGDQLWVRGPFGAPWDLDADGHDVVIAAGGIGLAPLRAAVYAILAERERYRSVRLVVGARTSADLLFAREYDAWRQRGIDIIPTVDHAEPGWSGRVGFVPSVVDDLAVDPTTTHALVCGPDPMMELTARSLVDRGVAPERVQLTLERNMQCGNGRCGHCQLGGLIVCRDGPVVRYADVSHWLMVGEL